MQCIEFNLEWVHESDCKKYISKFSSDCGLYCNKAMHDKFSLLGATSVPDFSGLGVPRNTAPCCSRHMYIFDAHPIAATLCIGNSLSSSVVFLRFFLLCVSFQLFYSS